jgi:dipeptidyl aminopeptidase/acylaminoacyl peptidase
LPDSSFLDQLLNLPTVEYAKISPDGRWVAFTWYRIQANQDVFIVPTGDPCLPVPFTNTPEATEFVSWFPDSSAIIVSEDQAGDERLRLFRIDLRVQPDGSALPGPMVPLTVEHPPYFIRGGSISPDGKTLYYGANYDFAKGALTEPTIIYRHDIQIDWRIPIARPDRPAFTTPELNSMGTHLIYTRKDRHPSGRQVYLVDVDGKVDREILNFGDQVKVFARWFPDGEHILVLSETTGSSSENLRGYIRLGVYHWRSAQIRWLIDDPERSIEGAWVSPEGSIIVNEIQRSSHHPSFVSPPADGWMQASDDLIEETCFPTLQGNLVPIGRARDGAWIALHYASTSPSVLVRISTQRSKEGSANFVSLTNVWEHTSLHPSDLVQAEDLGWASTDGLPIQGWLYRTDPNLGRGLVYIHGGPNSHSEDYPYPMIQYLVRVGFNILAVNYRGSTGFGLQFREAIKLSGWGGQEQADISSAAQELINLGLAHPGKVGVTGTSYGGYCAWWQITHLPPELIAAAAPICGMTDLVADYETTRPDLRPLSEEMMGGSPAQVPERYYERSPINFVQHIRGRLLIVQGARDPNVTPANMHLVTEKLDRHHIPYELLIFDDEGHGIHKPANQKRLYARLAEFFSSAFE